MKTLHAFTLVELLVVVSIIVILIAMITPALDRAIYQAEMAICASKQHAVVGGAVTYAIDHKRRFPDRGAIRLGRTNEPTTIRFTKELETFDDAAQFKGYIAYGRGAHLNCPMTPEVDLEGSKPQTWVYSNYPLYFGWTLTGPAEGQKQTGMKKLGDRLIWPRQFGARLVSTSISVMVSDEDLIMPLFTRAWNTHPDGLERLAPWTSQDDAGTGAETLYSITRSAWLSTTTHQRGPVDLNFGLQDGSAFRIDNIPFNELEQDGRIVKIPYTWDSINDTLSFRHIAAR